MVNAKEELLKIVMKNQLTIAEIDCRNYELYYNNPQDEWYVYPEDRKNYKSLEDLDFNYYPNNDYYYELYGVVYCYDNDDNPVWLTRCGNEYEPEHWVINRIPIFYRK